MRTLLSLTNLLLVIFLGSNVNAGAQLRYSVIAGYSFDVFKGKDLFDLGDNYALEIEAEKNIRQYGTLSIGLLYMKSGYNNGYANDPLWYNDRSQLKNKMIVLPIEYRWMDISRIFCLSTGIETRYLAESILSESYNNIEYNINVTNYSVRVQPFYVIGMGINFGRIKFKMRYCWGLTNTFNKSLYGKIPFPDNASYYIRESGGKIKQESIQFFLGFQF